MGLNKDNGVAKYNHNHDERGRFTDAAHAVEPGSGAGSNVNSGGGGGNPVSSSNPPAHAGTGSTGILTSTLSFLGSLIATPAEAQEHKKPDGAVEEAMARIPLGGFEELPPTIKPYEPPPPLPIKPQPLETPAIKPNESVPNNSGPPASTPVGRSGNPIEIEPGTNKPVTVDDVIYSGHAIDRLQGRGIPLSAVKDTLVYGERLPQGNGTDIYYSSDNNICVFVNRDTNVIITVRQGKP